MLSAPAGCPPAGESVTGLLHTPQEKRESSQGKENSFTVSESLRCRLLPLSQVVLSLSHPCLDLLHPLTDRPHTRPLRRLVFLPCFITWILRDDDEARCYTLRCGCDEFTSLCRRFLTIRRNYDRRQDS